MPSTRQISDAAPGWTGIAMAIAAVLAASSMLWAGVLPGGNLALSLSAAAAIIAASLAGVPLVVEGLRTRRMPWAVVVSMILVLAAVGVSVSSTPLRIGASTVADDLTSAADSGDCPSVAGLYRVVECAAVDDGMLFFVDGAGAGTPAGFAILPDELASTHVSSDGFSVAVWHIDGPLYGFHIDYAPSVG